MSENENTKPWWRPLAVVGGVGLVVLIVVGALLLAAGLPRYRRANESAALSTLGAIAARQHAFLTENGRHATFQELIEAGGLGAEFTGELPAAHGYVFTMKITPKSDAQPSSYAVNADPRRREGLWATGRRHFYLDSRITGIRYNEERPAAANDRPVK